MGRSEQISQDLVKDWMHVVGKEEEVVATVMAKFPAAAAGGWEENSGDREGEGGTAWDDCGHFGTG